MGFNSGFKGLNKRQDNKLEKLLHLVGNLFGSLCVFVDKIKTYIYSYFLFVVILRCRCPCIALMIRCLMNDEFG